MSAVSIAWNKKMSLNFVFICYLVCCSASITGVLILQSVRFTSWAKKLNYLFYSCNVNHDFYGSTTCCKSQ